MEDDGILYGHLVYFTANREILWPFGTFCGHLIFPPPFWYIVQRKLWQPWTRHSCRKESMPANGCFGTRLKSRRRLRESNTRFQLSSEIAPIFLGIRIDTKALTYSETWDNSSVWPDILFSELSSYIHTFWIWLWKQYPLDVCGVYKMYIHTASH
jgi:hypothetical protein